MHGFYVLQAYSMTALLRSNVLLNCIVFTNKYYSIMLGLIYTCKHTFIYSVMTSRRYRCVRSLFMVFFNMFVFLPRLCFIIEKVSEYPRLPLRGNCIINMCHTYWLTPLGGNASCAELCWTVLNCVAWGWWSSWAHICTLVTSCFVAHLYPAQIRADIGSAKVASIARRSTLHSGRFIMSRPAPAATDARRNVKVCFKTSSFRSSALFAPRLWILLMILHLIMRHEWTWVYKGHLLAGILRFNPLKVLGPV